MNINANCYEDSIEALRNTFKKLVLNITGGLYIRFQDPVVQSICGLQWGDGNGCTKDSFTSVITFPEKAFTGNSSLQYFPELGDLFVNCTTIANFAFKDCQNLRVCTLPAGLKKIGNSSFANCVNLTEIEIPNGVSIDYAAFGNCGLTRVIVPKDTVYLSGATFNNCRSLKEAVLEEGLSLIHI